MSKASIINDLRETTSGGGGGFSGTRIPFLKVPSGKTRLLFLSDLEDEDSNVPDIRFYQYYKVPGRDGIELNGSTTYEVYYEAGDPILDIYKKDRIKQGKKLNPKNFPKKGFAYVVNLTFIKAIRFWEENGKKPTRNDISDLQELSAAKEYIDQYTDPNPKKGILKRHEAFREAQLEAGEDDPGEFVLHGIFIYNFGFSVTKEMYGHIQTLIDDEVDPEDISMREYVFQLSKSGKDLDTKYSFAADYRAEDVDTDLTAPAEQFIGGLENGLDDFEGLLERRRNKPKDEDGTDTLEDDYKVSKVAGEEGASGW